MARRSSRPNRANRSPRAGRQRSSAKRGQVSRRRSRPNTDMPGDLSWTNPSLSINPIVGRVQAAGALGDFMARRTRPRRRGLPGWIFLLLAAAFLLWVYVSVR